MNTALTLALIWAVAGSACGLLPRRYHWPIAWALIVTGIPLLGLVTWKVGPLAGLVALLAGASILRWPLLRLFQQVTGRKRERVETATD